MPRTRGEGATEPVAGGGVARIGGEDAFECRAGFGIALGLKQRAGGGEVVRGERGRHEAETEENEEQSGTHRQQNRCSRGKFPRYGNAI